MTGLQIHNEIQEIEDLSFTLREMTKDLSKMSFSISRDMLNKINCKLMICQEMLENKEWK